MSDKTGIQWTDATWNPVRGCSRVSEGCRNCYAERVAARFAGPGQPYHGLAKVTAPRDDLDRVGGRRNGWTGVVRMVPEHLADPLRWRKPRRIFVNSMSDLFHEKLTNEEIAAAFGVMAAAPRHTFQVLTKRAERMRDWFRWALGFGELRSDVLRRCRAEAIKAGAPIVDNDVHADGVDWPLPNVWLGVSVENQAAADERIPLLLETPAALRFLSCEPLLGPVQPRPFTVGQDSYCHDCGGPGVKVDEDGCCATCGGDALWFGVDWIIAGCESGPGARPAQVDWYRALRDQCAAAGVPFFLKQATHTPGDFVTVDSLGRKCSATLAVGFDDGSERKAGGVIGLPYLDGVQHAAFPGRA